MTNEQLVIHIKAGEDVSGNMAQLWEQTRRFIHTIAARYQGQAEIEDLEQEGYLALCDAVDGYNPAAGFLTHQHIQTGRCLLKNFRKIQWCHRLSVQMHQKQAIQLMMESVGRFIIICITVILRMIVRGHK